MISIPITALFIGVFVVLQIPLAVMVGDRRARTGIQFFDGATRRFCVACGHTAIARKPCRWFSLPWRRQS